MIFPGMVDRFALGIQFHPAQLRRPVPTQLRALSSCYFITQSGSVEGVNAHKAMSQTASRLSSVICPQNWSDQHTGGRHTSNLRLTEDKHTVKANTQAMTYATLSNSQWLISAFNDFIYQIHFKKDLKCTTNIFNKNAPILVYLLQDLVLPQQYEKSNTNK